jgi:hypothetical protein
MIVRRRKVEDWLARCRWLATTKLDDRTRDRLDRLVRTLEQDLEEDEASGYLNGDLEADLREGPSSSFDQVWRARPVSGRA